MDDENATDGFGMKNRSDLVKRDNFFIHKDCEKYKTLPDAVETLYVLFFLVGNPWYIQSTRIWSLTPNDLP